MREYFSHDYDEQHDEKIVKLVFEMGWEGYGLYWALIERLYSSGGYLVDDYKRIAYALHTDSGKLEKLINEYSLFEIKSGFVFSNSVNFRLKERRQINAKRKHAAKIRWKNQHELDDANSLQMQSTCNASKVNKSKVKERKEKSINKATNKIFEKPNI